MLGQKVVQRYFRGENYVETDVYVGSSIIAMQIVGLCRGYAKHFACDIGMISYLLSYLEVCRHCVAGRGCERAA